MSLETISSMSKADLKKDCIYRRTADTPSIINIFRMAESAQMPVECSFLINISRTFEQGFPFVQRAVCGHPGSPRRQSCGRITPVVLSSWTFLWSL